jgi:hypothetical protein
MYIRTYQRVKCQVLSPPAHVNIYGFHVIMNSGEKSPLHSTSVIPYSVMRLFVSCRGR